MAFISGQEIEIFMFSEWREKFSSMNRQEVFQWRRSTIDRLSGDLLPPIQSWPAYMRRLFFQTAYPHGDTQTFMLYLYFVGNALNPLIAAKWILSSFALCTWNKRERILRKRITQLKWITQNLPRNQHRWRYFDLHERRVVYFNGRQYFGDNV